MRRMILLTLGFVALCALQAGVASAISISVVPGTQTANPGDTLSVDIVISDLGSEIVSAYDLDLTYDATVLSATDVVFGANLGDELLFEVFNDFDLSGTGVVDFAQLSLLSDAELAALQPSSFSLATVEFLAVGPGTSSLDFVFDSFNDIKGRNAGVLDVDAVSGSVSVVPEPSSALVFAVGSLIAGTAVSRKHTREARR